MFVRILIFSIINFAALGIGGYLTGGAVRGEWYNGLIKAPWTPPGWVFGAAWTLIMICFSIYLAILWNKIENSNLLLILFVLQWLLNVGWNVAFFANQEILIGLIIICSLTLLVSFFLFNYWQDLRLISLLILPYLIWLLIASSLNIYIYLKN